MMFKKKKVAVRPKKGEPVEDEFDEEPIEEEEQEPEEEEEVEEEEAPKKKLPRMPKPPTEQPAPLTKEEVISLAEVHLTRAAELLAYSRSVK